MEVSAEDYKAFKAQHGAKTPSVKEMGERMKQPEEGMIPMESMVSKSTEKYMTEHGADDETSAVAGLAMDLLSGGMASKGVAMAGKAMKKGVQVGQRALSDTMKASEIKRPQFEMQSIHDLAGETKAQDAADTIAIKKVRDRIVAQNTAHAKAKATEHAHEQAQIKADEAMTKTVAERNKAKNELADKAKRAEKAKSRAKSEALRLHEATVEAKNAADDAATKKVRERMIAKNAHEAKAAKIKAAEHDPHDWEGQIEHTVESDKKMIAEIAARNRAKLPTEESHDFGYGGH